MEVNKELLQDVIDGFAKDGKVFTNESQFQFELGYALQRRFDEAKTGYKVLFEVLSLNKDSIDEFISLDKEEKEKFFTDIIVDMGEKCIAIELKYKISQCGDIKAFNYKCNNNDYYAFAQGAYNIGCCDFWWDVYRLERLVDGKVEYNFTGKTVEKGFAIIMTNDDNYKKEHKSSCKNFILVDKTKTEGKRKWFDKKNDCDVDKYPGSGKTKYGDGIDISRPYSIEWDEYNLPEGTRCFAFSSGDKNDCYGNFKFNYLILEID